MKHLEMSAVAKNKFSVLFIFTIVIGLFLFYSPKARSEPPFLTEDADTAEYREMEVFPFASITSAAHTEFITAPALQVEYGLIPRVEIEVIIPVITYVPITSYIEGQGRTATGIGDILAHLKYQILKESPCVPALSILVEEGFPTGSENRELGNGRSFTSVPLSIGKTWEPWSTYASIGMVFNSADNDKNYLFGGWVVERKVNEEIDVGAEIFLQGATNRTREAPDQDAGAVTLMNFGGKYHLNKESDFLISAGHSVSGIPQWIGYVGLEFEFQV